MYLSAFVVAVSTWGSISSVRPLPLPLHGRLGRLHGVMVSPDGAAVALSNKTDV